MCCSSDSRSFIAADCCPQSVNNEALFGHTRPGVAYRIQCHDVISGKSYDGLGTNKAIANWLTLLIINGSDFVKLKSVVDHGHYDGPDIVQPSTKARFRRRAGGVYTTLGRIIAFNT